MGEELLLKMLSDPQMADQLSQMSAYGDRAALLGKDSQRADAMRAVPTPEGRHVGNTYVASSPLEHLGVIAQHVLGAKQMGDVRGQQQSLMQGDMTARKGLAAAMADAMRRSREGAPAEAVQSPQMLGDNENLGG